MGLLRLAYVSQSRLAGDPDERAHIADILLSSRRNNEEENITGALLATDNCFAQVLEGGRRAVEATFERISHDPRHQDIALLLSEPIAGRQFPQWSMAYIGPSQSAADAVARVTRDVETSEAGEAARALVTFMSKLLEECPGGGTSAP
jgi:Sensors of blue-light using FAD